MECGYNFNGWKDYVSKINVYCITVVPVRSCGIEDTDFAGEYVGDYPQCIKKEKAIVSIQATTDSLIYYASAQEITNFFSTDKSTQELEKILAEELFVQTYKRLLDIYCKTPTELYVDLVRRYPDFLNYITLREIASFLRVTPETISHIRKNIKGIEFC